MLHKKLPRLGSSAGTSLHLSITYHLPIAIGAPASSGGATQIPGQAGWSRGVRGSVLGKRLGPLDTDSPSAGSSILGRKPLCP